MQILVDILQIAAPLIAIGIVYGSMKEKFANVVTLIKAEQGKSNLKVQEDLTKMDKRLTNAITGNKQEIAVIKTHLKLDDAEEG